MFKKTLLLLALLLLLPFGNIKAVNKYATVFNPIDGSRKVVEVGSPDAFSGGYLLEVARAIEVSDDKLGFSVVTNFSKNLSSSISATQNTIPVTSMTTKDGHTLTMGDVGSKGFLVIEPGARKEEIVMFTGISGNSFTGVTRGLAFYGTSTAAVSANQKTHSSGSSVIISNTHYVYDELVDKDADETIAGVKTFTDSPIVPSPSSDTQAANKAYVDNVAQQGGATSTEATTGISQLATQTEMAETTFDADNPQVIPTKYSTSSPDVAGSYAIISESDGKLNQGWLDTTEDLSWTGDTTFASTTFSASTTWDILPEYDSDPIGDDEAVRKSYVDDSIGSKLLYATTTSSTAPISTVEYTMLTFTIPANSLSTSNLVNVYLTGKFYSTGGYNTTYRLKLNGDTTCSVIIDGNPDSNGTLEIKIFADKSTSAQVCELWVKNPLAAKAGNYVPYFNSEVATVDSTSDITVTLTIKKSNSNAGENRIDRGYAELLK